MQSDEATYIPLGLKDSPPPGETTEPCFQLESYRPPMTYNLHMPKVLSHFLADTFDSFSSSAQE